MTNNTWAYSTDDVNFQGVPTIDSPTLLSDIDGVNVGTNTNGVVSATIPVYYAAKVDTSIPSGSYANSVTYSAVVDGGIVTNAELTSITVDGDTVEQLQLDKTNAILVTTNLKTNTYGTPRAYYTTTSPSGYAECGNVVVASNAEGYMTIQCETTPTTVATGLTLHIVPKGTPSSTSPSEMTGDPFCSDGTYQVNTSECEAGEWKWGSFTVALPDTNAPVFNGIKTMQEMTPQICADAQENDTTMLEDARDGKKYWVAKLKDGNCWMTQNLELDLSTDTPLTSELSDVTSSWTPTSNTYTSAQDGSSSDYVAQSWDLGKYVWKTPNSTSYCEPDTNFSESSCASYWQNVSSGWTPMTQYRTDGVTYDASSQTYDAHYLAGNYYSWDAATVNSVGDTGTATQSICPKGFELPLNNGDKSYNFLISAYDTAVEAAMSSAPLFFVRSGSVYPRDYLYDAGRYGGYWSSHTNSSSHAFYLHLDSSFALPSDRMARESGLSVRCVAPSA